MKGIAQVLICDGVPDSKGNTIRIAGLTLPTEDVPVVLEFQERYLPAYVGRAKLQMNAGVVYADLILLPRLGENSALFTLYPILVFKDIDQRDKVMYSGRAEYVGLSITCNPDQRIRTLGEQGVRP